MAKKKSTPQSQLRSLIMKRFGMRGHHYSNIWIFYSRKTQRDWAVASDLEFDFAMYLEASPEVASFDLNPPEVMVRVGDEDRKTQYDAIVRYTDGRIEAIEIKYAADQGKKEGVRITKQREAQITAAARDNLTYRRVTDIDLRPHAMLIANWRRVNCYLSAVRLIAMGSARELAAAALRRFPAGASLREVLSDVELTEHPARLAATFELVQQGHYACDIAAKPLSWETRFTPAAGGAQ